MLTDREAKTIFKQTFDDWFFYNHATWELKFVWFPQRCEISKKRLWLTYEYRGISQRFFNHLPDDIRWLSIEEFTLFALKKTID